MAELLSMILSFRRKVNENCHLLVCYAASSGKEKSSGNSLALIAA
jgi:hypothetical protein